MRTGFFVPVLAAVKKCLKNKSVGYNTALCIRANEVSAKVPLSEKKLRAGGEFPFLQRSTHSRMHHTGRQAPKREGLEIFQNAGWL